MPFTSISNRAYLGTAVPTTVTSFALGTNSAGTFLVADTSSWIDVVTNSSTPSNPFVVAVGVGTSNEEKMLVKLTAAGTLVVQTGGRNYDAASGAGYDWSTVSSPIVAPVWSAVEAYEANLAAVSCANLNNRGTNATPGNIITGVGSPGISNYAANADHVHQLPAQTIKDVITSTYINGSLTDSGVQIHVPSTYVNTSLTDVGVQAHVPSTYIQSSQAYPTGGTSSDPVPQAYIRSKQLNPVANSSSDSTTTSPLSTSTGTTKVLATNAPLTNFTNYMWIAKMSTYAAPSTTLEVLVQLLDNTSAIGTATRGAYILSTTASTTIVATGLFVGTPSTTYNFNFGCYTSGGTVNANRGNLTVIGLS